MHIIESKGWKGQSKLPAVYKSQNQAQKSEVACPVTHNPLVAKLEFVAGSPDSKSVLKPQCHTVLIS